jgi:hypothetical protein
MLTSILNKNTLKLVSLNISGNMIGEKNFAEICVGVSKNSHLIKLFTAENDLGKISATILGTIIRYDKKLKVLDVSKNPFGDNSIGYLLKGLISNVTLQILLVCECSLTNSALRNFETTMSINTSLREIFLDKNLFTNKSYEKISEILNKNNYLEFISLAGNRINIDYVDTIIDLQKKIPAKIITKNDYFKSKLSNEATNFYEYF